MNSKRVALLVVGAFSFCASCNKPITEDAKFINNINDIVKKNLDKITTCSDAINLALEEGQDIQSYKFADEKNKLAFDIDSKCFCLFNQKKEVVYAPSGYKLNENPYHFFVLVDNYNSSAEYSQYLTRNFVGSDLLVATTGLDMGENKNVKNITYYNNSGIAKDVILNVNCDYLNISAPLDNIAHYGSANNVFVPTNYTGAFREYAECSYIQISGGTFYLEDSSYADIVEVPSGCTPTIYQSENSNVLARFNANIRAQSNIHCKEIDNSNITIDELQALLNDTSYNFYRLTTEARDIVLKDGYLEFNRNLFFDLNGRSITFMRGADVQIEKEEHPKEEKDRYETYKTGILVTGKYNEGKNERDVSAFLLDTQSTLYQRSGINLLDCSILVKGNDDENTAVNFYINSGKIHDVRGSQGTGHVSSPAVLLIGNILQDNKDRKPKYCNFYMYGGYIKTEKGVEWNKGKSHKCIQPRGLGCTLNMIYGDLESFHFAISGQGYAANENYDVDKYGNTTINIIGGNIVGGTEDASYPALFFPQSGVVNITGGKITGPSCIDAKAGTINIYGGEFNATKDPYDEGAKASEDGGACDGSVIFMESAKCYHGAMLDPLKINVEYSTMYSKTGHIVKAKGYKRESEKGYAGLSINFKDGEFSYKKDDPIICGEEIKDVFSSSINGGTWSKHE